MAVVYEHRRNDTGEIFYVGIGNKKRPYSKRGRNKWWKRIVKKYDYTVEVVKKGLSWEDACKEEIRLIKFYGRKDKGLGPLVNLTDGGEGTQGYVYNDKQRKENKILQTLTKGKKIYLYEIYSDKVFKFNSKRDAIRFLINNNSIVSRTTLFDKRIINGDYLVSYKSITLKEKIDIVFNTPQTQLKVLQMDMDFNHIISEYPSGREASKINKCITILSVLNKNRLKNKSALGFRWIYKLDYIHKDIQQIKREIGLTVSI